MFRFICAIAVLVCSPSGWGQAPGVTIFDQSSKGRMAEEKRYAEQVEALLDAGELTSLEEVEGMLEEPTSREVNLVERSAEPMTATAIAAVAQGQNFRVGWAYICNRCDRWHFKLAGGYAVSKDGVIVSCAHVIERESLPDGVRKAALIVVDAAGKVHPVTAILANHVTMDAAVLTIEAETVPYALNDEVRPGDAAFCYSRPMGQGRYFTEGIVNRFYWFRSPKGEDLESLPNLARLKMNVSCRWAPGSSGSPVFDRFGNVIGHVARINTKGKDKDEISGNDVLITFHIGIPARSVRALIEKGG